MPLRLTRNLLALALGAAMFASPPGPARAIFETADRAAPDAPLVYAPAATRWFVDPANNDSQVAYWKFDEGGTVTRTLDFSPGANHAFFKPGVGFSVTTPVSITRFDPFSLDIPAGVTQAVTVANSASLNLSTTFALTFWVRRAASDLNTPGVIYQSGTQTNFWYVTFLSNNRIAFSVRDIADYSSATGVVSDTNWHHIAVRKNGDAGVNLLIFLDGALVHSASVGALATPGGPKMIGDKHDSSTPFTGQLDELRLHPVSLATSGGVGIPKLASGRGCIQTGTSWAGGFNDLQCALDEAASGDEIWVAAGAYRPGTHPSATFRLKDGISLFGGFNATETLLTQRPAFVAAAPLTILSGDILGDDNLVTLGRFGDNAWHVVTFGSGVSGRLDRFGIRSGSAVSLSLNGGGLLADPGAGLVSLSEVAFLSNKASRDGGGAFIAAAAAITGSVFQSNTAGSNGGGLALTDTARITSSIYLSNTGIDGGGIHAGGALALSGGRFQGNRATAFYGGGISAGGGLTITGADFFGNFAGFGGGAVASDSGPISVMSSTFSRNQANTFSGGALDAGGVLDVRASTFQTNNAPAKGGAINASAEIRVSDSAFSGNRVSGTNCLPACQVVFSGGGAIAATDRASVISSTFVNNSSRVNGGAIWATGRITVARSSLVANRAAMPFDGLNNGRGGAIFVSGILRLERSVVLRNTATLGGSGVAIDVTPPLDGTLPVEHRIVNTLLAANGITTNLGAGIFYSDSFNMLGVVHTTIGAPGKVTGSAVEVVTGTARLTDTLIASHTVGISTTIRPADPVLIHFGGFGGNDADSAGSVSGVSAFASPGDPRFVNPAADDYHLAPSSPAIFHCVNAGIVEDFDGDLRPQFGNADCGYDEAVNVRAAFTPVVFR